ncbi:hypothetical protein GF420_05820 [candidate division GN15 bacterium]|nr:hypothetical protein [candidate division GN15 bacterium]
MRSCFFVSDLHGRIERYQKLFARIEQERPAAVFIGGDLLSHGLLPHETIAGRHGDFVNGFLKASFTRLRDKLGEAYPDVFVILGNDDNRSEEAAFMDVATTGLWHYAHNRSYAFGSYRVYGYAFAPPTPFVLKDWERYDVSRYVDPGCISPEEGARTVPVSDREKRYRTIKDDLAQLVGQDDLSNALMLFHTPPYQTMLDRAALDGKMIDHVPLDVHVGSIALRRFIEARGPKLTMHGHIHESARLTGAWMDRLGDTICLSAAHDGDELALVRFDPAGPAKATRELL